LTAVSIDGRIYQWKLNYNTKAFNVSITMNENENDLYSLDYNFDGTKFAVSSRMNTIKIYDETTKVPILDLSTTGPFKQGHSNRIYSVKFTDLPDVLLSGGWDRTLKIWDLRIGQAIASITGLEIGGDSIDAREDHIMVGNNRTQNSIQEYSLSKRALIKNYLWDKDNPLHAPSIYSLRMSQPKKFMVACGSDPNEAGLFDLMNDCSLICGISNLPLPCFCADIANLSRLIAIGSGDGYIRIFSWKD